MTREGGSGLGMLEAEVLKHVKVLGRASAAEVLESMTSDRRSIAYTTVGTTLDRLHRKGLLERGVAVGKGGRRFVYSCPKDSKAEREIVGRAVDRLVGAFGPSAVSAIYDRLDELTKDDVEELRRMVEGRRARAHGPA